MELIALLSTGKGTWGQVSGLIKHGDWEKIILLGSDFAEKFTADKKFEFIKVDLDKKLVDLKEEFLKKLKGKIAGHSISVWLPCLRIHGNHKAGDGVFKFSE